ncbi:phosphoenolpyruvate carboxylase [Candidatus Uhrbacteria bacterium]|nr:phosphoenolpyruvate carboxylase [Candidatus Uhrbacteria bacterium]
MTRRIPATMGTQHPDNAAAPYWETDGDAFVNVHEEVDECHSAFADLGCEEYMWDWEGKFVDEAVIDRLFSQHHAFFTKRQIGRDVFLTFRIPNIWEEKGYSLGRALMGILTAEDMAYDLGIHRPPLFEVILPMADRADKLLHIQKTFSSMAELKHRLFDTPKNDFTYVEIIPLIEGVEHLFGIRKLLDDFVALHVKQYGCKPAYIRPFLARSDPALVSGLVPAVLAVKAAISEAYRFSADTGIPVFPIVGTGSLVFRGGLAPNRVKKFVAEYGGVCTATIQSGFRYDYPLDEAKKGIRYLNANLAAAKPLLLTAAEIAAAKKIAEKFTVPYRAALKNLYRTIMTVADAVPRRRERRLHIGLLGYGRKVGGKRFPRAINFTAALYSLGVPPEFLGLGRGYAALTERERALLRKMYRGFDDEVVEAGRYLNAANLAKLCAADRRWQPIAGDIAVMASALNATFGPETMEQELHAVETSALLILLKNKKDFAKHIIQSGRLRRSLG